MRKVPTYVGATTGNNGRTEGLPEVQESVLEHAAPEAQNPQVTGKTLSQNSDVVNLVTNVTEIRKTERLCLTIKLDDPAVAAVLRTVGSLGLEYSTQKDVLETAARWLGAFHERWDSYANYRDDTPKNRVRLAAVELEIPASENRLPALV